MPPTLWAGLLKFKTMPRLIRERTLQQCPRSSWLSSGFHPIVTLQSGKQRGKKASQGTAGSRHLRCCRLNWTSGLVWSTDSWGAAGRNICSAPTANQKYAAIFTRQRMAKRERATHAEPCLKWPGWIWFRSSGLPWGRRHPCGRVLPRSHACK